MIFKGSFEFVVIGFMTEAWWPKPVLVRYSQARLFFWCDNTLKVDSAKYPVKTLKIQG